MCRPSTLAIRGGSNGGLLVGNMYTMRPDLFGAVHCAVPLLDMRRYHVLLAGASWMAEYGDPDTDDWENSTWHNRVHPAHAHVKKAETGVFPATISPPTSTSSPAAVREPTS